ncbi:MAG TPA: hypothetical protein VLY83_02865 [Methanoregula sp.]|nr:hypothetical protein [Methanoregula sp.]
MNTPQNLAGILSIVSIVLSVIGLVISPVSAAAMTSPATGGGGAGIPAAGYHHAFNATQQQERISAELARLGQQGIDVSQPQADIAGGNTTAAVQWLMSYYKANPGAFGNQTRPHPVNINSTQQTARLQGFFTKLGQQGVDVTQALADLSTGNLKGAMQWLMGYHQAHPAVFGNMTRPGMFGNAPPAVNMTRMTDRLQASLTKLGQQGVDISQPQADIASGNATAAMQWLMAYHKAHPGPAMNATFTHTGNTSAWQKGGSFRPHRQPFGNKTSGHPSWVPTRTQGA